MNSVSKLKNTKNGVFALITNGVGGNLSNFTGLASIVANALILPPIYYFFKLIDAKYRGYCAIYGRYDNVKELVKAIPDIMRQGKLISDPRKEKGVMAGKTSIYRLTCVIGSAISFALSVLSLYSFISSWRFKNQMNARDMSFAILSPLVAAVTIFLQGQLVGGRLPKSIKNLIKRIAKGIGINRPHSTLRDVKNYKRSEIMKGDITTPDSPEMGTGQIIVKKPYYYSFRCVLSLSFAAFAQSIAVCKLPNTMRISAFIVCANLCFALSKLILDVYYAYQCNIYDKQNIVVAMGEKVHGVGAEPSDERSLLQIRLSGTLSELREALHTKLKEFMGLLKQKAKDEPEKLVDRKQLVENATLLSLALDSLENPTNLGLSEDVTATTGIAMDIGGKTSPEVGKRAIYSTGFNGSDSAVLKADLIEEECIHTFKGGKVKMEDQHLCYDRKQAASLIDDEGLAICRLHTNVGGVSLAGEHDKVTVTSLKLVTLGLVAIRSAVLNTESAAEAAILEAIKKVATNAEEQLENPAEAFDIDPKHLLQHITSIDGAFGFEVAKVSGVGAK